jgi:condensin complex subunit 3
VQDQPTDETIHIDLASDIARALFDDKIISTSITFRSKPLTNTDIAEEDKKVLYQVLGRLYLPDKVDDDKIRTLKLLLHNLNSVSSSGICINKQTHEHTASTNP